MKVNEIVIYNILKELDRLNNDTEFKSKYPDITAQEYLFAKVNNHIKAERLINILQNKSKTVRISEISYIANALNIPLYELFKENKNS